MKLILISMLTPTHENTRGASALSYHIAKFRPQGTELVIYSFNSNGISQEKIAAVEQELGCQVKLMSLPWWWNLVIRLLPLRILLRLPFAAYLKLPDSIVKEIKALNPDGIWVNCEEMWRVCHQFDGMWVVHTLPDCESLYYKRMMQADFVKQDASLMRRQRVMYPKYRRMERHFKVSPLVTCHLVGDADARELQSVCPGIDARFIRHPHYEVRDAKREIKFGEPIRLLVAGQYNLYMQSTADEWFSQMREAKELCEHYVITFLGRGWEPTVQMLREAGFRVNHIAFAPDYIEEVCRHDIQLTPISIGTGTKGKVLDAIANGLLVIGTTYAMENIAVKHASSCIVVDDAHEMLNVLRDVPQRGYIYEQLAKAGRKTVLTEHGRDKVSTDFFNLFTEGKQ